MFFLCFFQALALPNDYNRGKVCAYELLCDLILSCKDINIPKDNVIEFYRVLHVGLTGTHQVSDCLINVKPLV